jgi:cytochrome c oxidase assembly protein subunit 15
MKSESIIANNRRQVAYWLLIGVGMIIIQVLLGGITRLTESGLSITEWKPITGILPPLDAASWQTEFDKYQNTDQFKAFHQHYSISDFKFIFFWEWFHRFWARMIGVVFLIGFVYFIVKKKFDKSMVVPMLFLFVFGAMQGAIGWIMVKSGLVPDKYFVGHIELTTHFVAALMLLSFTLWFALSLLPRMQEKLRSRWHHNMLLLMLVVFLFQLIYGGFMAGLKAAQTAPTWPSINGKMIPDHMGTEASLFSDVTNNPITIHFIHRGIAYLLLILALMFYFSTRKINMPEALKKFRNIFLALIFIQVSLGVFSLLTATGNAGFVWFAAAHQFVAMLLVMCMVTMIYLTRRN